MKTPAITNINDVGAMVNLKQSQMPPLQAEVAVQKVLRYIVKHRGLRNKYPMPHQGVQECARRRGQP